MFKDTLKAAAAADPVTFTVLVGGVVVVVVDWARVALVNFRRVREAEAEQQRQKVLVGRFTLHV